MRLIRFVVLVPLSLLAAQHIDTLDVNRWLFPLTDYGPCGVGATWRTPSHNYLFGVGPWFGATVNDDTLVSIGYNPNSAASEFKTGDSLGDSLSMVYIWPDRWPPPQSRFPRAPQERRSAQDAWCCFNDFDSTHHVWPGRPLRLQTYLTAYAWQGPVAEDIIFLRYEFENQSAGPLQHCYAGIGLDPDIGAATDDMFGVVYHRWVKRGSDSVYVDHVAFAYGLDGQQTGWDTAGVVGAVLLHTPGDHGATAIKKFTIDIDPVTDPDQYLTMAGYDYRTGVYSPIDSVDIAPGDKRFLVASGPFDLAPGQSESLVVVIIGSTFWPESLSFAQELEVAKVLYSGVAEERGTLLQSRMRVWPNPFNHALWFEPAEAGATGTAEIRDVSGRLVRTFAVDGRSQWWSDDSRGRQVAPGVYFVSFGDERLKVVRR